jgi:transcriptional regulator with XRE-family HTH domain
MDTPGERLRQARERAGLSVDELADRIGSAASTVRAHENGQNNVRPHKARDYATALKVSPTWLLYGGNPTQAEQLPRPATQSLPIRFTVAAGAWEPVDDIRDEPLGFMEAHQLPAYEGIPQWIERLAGDSYDRKIPDGSLLHVVDAIALGYAPNHGDTVIVCRRRAQGSFVERSVKEVVLTPFGVELWPRSHNPKWDQPLNYTTGTRGGDDIEVEIVGKVVRAYQDL